MKIWRNPLLRRSFFILIAFALLICTIPIQEFTGIIKAATPVQIENAKIQRYDADHPNDFNADKLVVSWEPNSEFTNVLKLVLNQEGQRLLTL
ncbi:hypothetical protein [Bacillus sp. AFS055030]|uniref:hypothetical protein n=1 Tax=Bacillus sp. AFS055030 TaxID=2033507 RepID=UPI000BFD0F50|nr:hypothetical protein [Bacillus sp. AFS055030]PGL70160.1 hypothetical protein CN925_13300 [Bacillus sp. AFS055030]